MCVLAILIGVKWYELSFFYKDFIYREEKGGRKRGRETSMCGCLSCALYQTGPQPKHVPWTGNQMGDPLICRLALNPLSYAS